MAKQVKVQATDALAKYTVTSVKTLAKITGDIAKLKTEADKLTIAGIGDDAGYKAVDEMRKVVKKLRTGVEAKRKELNEPALLFQRELNAAAKTLTEKLTPVEQSLEKKLAEIDQINMEVELAAALKVNDRRNQLFSRGALFNGTEYNYDGVIVSEPQLSTLTDEDWAETIALIDTKIKAVEDEAPIFAIDEPGVPEKVQENAPKEEIPVFSPVIAKANTVSTAPGNMEPTPSFMDAITEYKGLIVWVYRCSLADSTANGASSRHEKMLLVGPGVPQIFTETNPDKVLLLKSKESSYEQAVTADGKQVMVAKRYQYLVPASIPENTHSMMGGNFAHTSDSRFPSGQPIAIHDRVE